MATWPAPAPQPPRPPTSQPLPPYVQGTELSGTNPQKQLPRSNPNKNPARAPLNKTSKERNHLEPIPKKQSPEGNPGSERGVLLGQVNIRTGAMRDWCNTTLTDELCPELKLAGIWSRCFAQKPDPPPETDLVLFFSLFSSVHLGEKGISSKK